MKHSGKHPKPRGWRVMAALIAVALVASACAADTADDDGSTETAAGEETTTSVAGSDTTAATAEECTELEEWQHLLSSSVAVGVAYFVAGQGVGFFEEECIDFVVQPSTGEAQTTQILASGRAASSTPNATAFILPAARGEEVPLEAVFNLVAQLHYFPAVMADSPIESVADLEGGKIGVSDFASSTHAYAQAYVDEVGLDPEADIEYVPVGQGVAAAEALAGGDVDALTLWDVTYASMQEAGYDLRFLPQSELGDSMFGNILAVHEDLVENNPDLVGRFLRAITKTVVFASENPEAAVCVFYNEYPEALPSGVDGAEAIASGANVVSARIPKLQPKEGMSFGEFAESEWETWVDFVDESESVTDTTSFFTNEFVDVANDFDHEAIRDMAANYECDL